MIILYIILYLILCCIPGFLSASLHEKKGYEGGFALGFWLGIMGLIYAAGLPDNSQKSIDLKSSQQQAKDENGEPINICPYCGHRIETNATICDKCGCGLPFLNV